MKEGMLRRRLGGKTRGVGFSALLFVALLVIFAVASLRLHSYGPYATRQSLTIPAQASDLYGTPGFAVPALRFAPTSSPRNVVAVITHGSPGNKEMMTTIAAELARAGITAYAYDLPGFGQSAETLAPSADAYAYSGDRMTIALDEVVQYALAHPPIAGQPTRLVLIGYSVGAEITGDYIYTDQANLPQLAATVFISGDAPYFAPSDVYPPNMLALAGQFDLPEVASYWREDVADVCQALSSPDRASCGDATDGTARRFLQLPLQDHVTMATAGATQSAILRWLGATVDPGISDARNDAGARWLWLLIAFAAAALALGPLLALGAAVERRWPSWPVLRRPGRFAATGSPAGLTATAPPAHTTSATGTDESGLDGQVTPADDVLAMTARWLLLGWIGILPALGLALLAYPRFDSSLGTLLRQAGTEEVWPGLTVFGLAWLVWLLVISSLRRRLAWPAWRGLPARAALALVLVAFLYLTLGQLSSYTWVSFSLPPPRLWRAALLAAGILPLVASAHLLLGGYAARHPWRGACLQVVALLLTPLALAGVVYQQYHSLGLIGILLPIITLVVLALAAFEVWARHLLAPPTILLALFEALIVGCALAAAFPIYG